MAFWPCGSDVTIDHCWPTIRHYIRRPVFPFPVSLVMTSTAKGHSLAIDIQSGSIQWWSGNKQYSDQGGRCYCCYCYWHCHCIHWYSFGPHYWYCCCCWPDWYSLFSIPLMMILLISDDHCYWYCVDDLIVVDVGNPIVGIIGIVIVVVTVLLTIRYLLLLIHLFDQSLTLC